VLEIRDLVKQYPGRGRPALDGVHLTVEKGEFIAILGLSGAGKSTLIRCINRLIEPTGGAILWQGENVLRKKGDGLRAYRRQIGMIFQNFHLIDRLSVFQNVLVGRFGVTPLWRVLLQRFREEDKRMAMQALERVGMADLHRVRADRLSGGQRQRVAIARALAQRPALILGDEPISSLDPATATAVMELLKSINQQEGITMVLNLHSVAVAKQYASRIIGLAGGKVVYDGTPQELDDSALSVIYPAQRQDAVETIRR